MLQTPAPSQEQCLGSAARMAPASFSGRSHVPVREQLQARCTRLSAGHRSSAGPQSWASTTPHTHKFAPCLAGQIQGATCSFVREEGLSERVIVRAAATADPTLPPAVEFTWPGGIESRYEMGEVLGQGSFGTVRKAHSKILGRDVAVKIIPKSKGNIEPARIYHRIREEVDVLQRVQKCPEAIHLFEIFESEHHVYLVTELCRGGTLEDFIKKHGGATEGEAAQVAHDILRVLLECHQQGLLYADVKPANFLLAQPYPDARYFTRDAFVPQRIQIKVVDFGCAQRVLEGQKLHKRTGTPMFMAPELFMQYFGLESDMWALGVLLFLMLSGDFPFFEPGADRSPWTVMSGILNGELKFEGEKWENVSPDAIDLISKLLDRDYSTRIGAAEALQHPWILSQCGTEGCLFDEAAIDMLPILSEQR